MCETKFSIIIPIYNRENTIKNVIDSIINQNYFNWELILVDDGSTDQSKDLCLKYTQKDSRIHYFYKKNGGVSSARNMGMRNAIGNYILFVDSDGSLKDGALSLLEKEIQHNKDAEIFCFGYSSLKESWIPHTSLKKNIVTYKNIRKTFLPVHINIKPQNEDFLKNYVWNKCYKREFLCKNELIFDENRRTWEDGIFIVNCLDKANFIVLIQKSLYNDYCDNIVEHLSSRIFEDQIKKYIEDEKSLKRRFETEYNYYNAHYCRANFDVLNILIDRTVNKYLNQSKIIIREVIDEKIIDFWISNVIPVNLFEQLVIELIKTRNVNGIYFLYRLRYLKYYLKNMLKFN